MPYSTAFPSLFNEGPSSISSSHYRIKNEMHTDTKSNKTLNLAIKR
jgi:hypothetical protein